jgi:hypothetical protein
VSHVYAVRPLLERIGPLRARINKGRLYLTRWMSKNCILEGLMAALAAEKEIDPDDAPAVGKTRSQAGGQREQKGGADPA